MKLPTGPFVLEEDLIDAYKGKLIVSGGVRIGADHPDRWRIIQAMDFITHVCEAPVYFTEILDEEGPSSPVEIPHPILTRPFEETWLTQELRKWIDPDRCLCEDEPPRPVIQGTADAPYVICANCWITLGTVTPDAWVIIDRRVKLTQNYVEATAELRFAQQQNPSWRVFMTDIQPDTIPDASSIRMIPGHIVYDSPDAAADGSRCNHRWILAEDNKARCILCEGERVLTKEELKIIEQAAQAGVVFLKWPERFAAMGKLRAPGRKARRRARKKGEPGVSRGVATAAQVPEGFIPVKEAAAKLGTDPKRLRKRIRNGHFEAAKVGGRVYVKID